MVGQDVMDYDDIRVAQSSRGAGFPNELAYPLRVVDGGEHLDGHGPLQACVHCLVDHAHAAFADLVENPVMKYRLPSHVPPPGGTWSIVSRLGSHPGH